MFSPVVLHVADSWEKSHCLYHTYSHQTFFTRHERWVSVCRGEKQTKVVYSLSMQISFNDTKYDRNIIDSCKMYRLHAGDNRNKAVKPLLTASTLKQNYVEIVIVCDSAPPAGYESNSTSVNTDPRSVTLCQV